LKFKTLREHRGIIAKKPLVSIGDLKIENNTFVK